MSVSDSSSCDQSVTLTSLELNFCCFYFFYPPTYREVSKHDMKKTLNLALWGARCDQRALFVTSCCQAMPVYSNGDQWLPGGAICDQCDQKRPVIGVFSVVFGQFFFAIVKSKSCYEYRG